MPGSRDQAGAARLSPPAPSPNAVSRPAGRPEPQRPRPARPNRRRTPHRAAQQPLRGDGREPETPQAGPREALGALGSRPLSGGPNRRRRRAYRGRESGREHLTALTLFRERTSTLEGTASPHPPVRPATAHARAGPAPPTGARAGARGTLGAGVFPPLPAGTRGALTCRHLSLLQLRLRPLRTLPRPSHSIPAVARAEKRRVSSDCSLFHTPRSQSSDPACSTGKYVQNPTTSHANTRPARAPPPSLPGLLKESAKGPLVPTPARHLSATYRRSGQLDH